MSASPPDDRLYVLHILDSIGRIRSYVLGMDWDAFHDTPLVQDGVIRQLQIIGEATKRLSFPLKARAPDVPWKLIAGMRDKLTHDYMGVDLHAVWLTSKHDLDLLESRVRSLLEQLPER